MSDTITLSVDGRPVTVRSGSTILEACAASGVKVPTLCHLPEVCSNASCGVCAVEVEGARGLVRSCVQQAREGMKVTTASTRVLESRRTVVELLLASHPEDCLSCLRQGSCELKQVAELVGVRKRAFPPTRAPRKLDNISAAIVRDNDKCILCGRCIEVCREVQGVSAIDYAGRSQGSRVAVFGDRSLADSVCVSCGQCTVVCPTGALTERDETDEVLALLRDPDKVVIVETAPAIRASLGEALGMDAGALVTGRMAAALRRLGFARVFDTQFAADLTIMEEGNELLARIAGTAKGKLPMLTSCSPGWISFIETFYPELLPHVSSCKSPQQMFGAIAKSWWAEKEGIDPAKLVVVSIMPCTAKKAEAKRPEMNDAWRWWKDKGRKSEPYQDVDYALSTRELARMIRRVGLDFARLPEEAFDDPLGASTGAATIFAATGGVMEAAVRTAYELVTGEALPGIELKAVRGFEGVKSATLALAGKELTVGVAHTLKNARAVLDGIAAGTSPYSFVEIMTCPGGCIGGGGQPVLPDWEKRRLRAEAIYHEDRKLQFRKSHENPAVAALYKDFLGQPLGHLSHELLHTEYKRKEVR